MTEETIFAVALGKRHPAEREAYLAMVSAAVRQRIDLRDEADTAGPRPDESADLLFIDSSHDRESVLAAFSGAGDRVGFERPAARE